MSTIELQVRGMSCAHCKQSVEEAVGGVTGPATVEADYVGGTVQIRSDGPIDLDTVKAAIRNAGYDVD